MKKAFEWRKHQRPVNFEASSFVVESKDKEQKMAPHAWKTAKEVRNAKREEYNGRWKENKKKAEQEGGKYHNAYYEERKKSLKLKENHSRNRSRTIYETLMCDKEMVSNAADTLTPQHKFELSKYM